MAFSFRKMLSNITYFTKPGEEDNFEEDSASSAKTYVETNESQNLDFHCIEPDSTSKQSTNSLKLPESIKNYAVNKASLSDTAVMPIEGITIKTKKKKLKLDIKPSLSNSDGDKSDQSNVENTPKQALLESDSSEAFSKHFKGFDFNQSFDIFDAMSNTSSISEEEEVDIESLSDESDTDISLQSDCNDNVQMCRKVESACDNDEKQLVPSATPESFGDVEIDKNEEDRLSLLLNYQMKLEKLDCFLKKLLTEFKFHIEISKVFHCRSIVTTLPGTDVSNIPKILGEVTYIDNLNRGVSPTDSWNIVMEKEDDGMKIKIKNQLLSMKHCIDDFVEIYLRNDKVKRCKKVLPHTRKTITYSLTKEKRPKHLKVNQKKKYKHFDFPDIRDAMLKLFEVEETLCGTDNNTTQVSDYDDSDSAKCVCKCHLLDTSSPQDSGLNTKNDRSMSITSSIGNFSLDNSTLTAYSESLDQIISYNSFQDTSLYSTLLQKAAIERIKFYVQVHSIQLICEATEHDFESKSVITFYCPSCKTTDNDENTLLKHILSQKHCEKIHFLYKTAYIQKCMSAGKEIMPSTVLNPMRMYRDVNKIVCFGDAMFACSLCFEHLITGESVLMSHCSNPEHVDRREKLSEILD